MKKMLGVFVLGIFLFSMMGIVSAGPLDGFVEGVNEVGKAVFEIAKPVLELVTGETAIGGEAGEDFLAKILFLMIILAIVWMSLSKVDFFSENGWILWIVSIGVSVLAIRWLGGSAIINTIMLPYSALGIAITAGIPFVLAFLIIENNFNKTMRKFAWLFFIVIFVGLWFSRYEDISKITDSGVFVYIYLVVAGLGLLMMLMDGTIQRWKHDMKIEKIGAASNEDAIGKILEKKNELAKLLTGGIINEQEMEKRRKKYNKQLAALHK